MELIIVKNGHVFARANDETAVQTDAFELRLEDVLPDAPSVPAGKGKEWTLDYVNGVLAWVLADRPLTQEERLEKVEEEIREQKYAWKVGEAVAVGDERFHAGNWYVCIQAHTTQADWTPDITPALWRLK